MDIERFKVVSFDEHNFAVYETRAITKGDNAGKEKDMLLGYYGSLAGALNKVCSEALKDSLEHSTADELLHAVRGLYEVVDKRYGSIKPNQFKKGEEL
jgi:hypothetical protein